METNAKIGESRVRVVAKEITTGWGWSLPTPLPSWEKTRRRRGVWRVAHARDVRLGYPPVWLVRVGETRPDRFAHETVCFQSTGAKGRRTRNPRFDQRVVPNAVAAVPRDILPQTLQNTALN